MNDGRGPDTGGEELGAKIIAENESRQVNVQRNYGTVDMSAFHEASPPVREPIISSLPPCPRTIIGRETEVQRILHSCRQAAVVCIDGMAGVGKTALVVRAAHRLAPCFPNGRYYIDLYAHTFGRAVADPSEILARLLVELGMDSRNVPSTPEGRCDEWRNRLAGKQALLVLDNALDQSQVEPLLPSGPDCRTLITSRRRLVGLDATSITLGTLERESAIELFRVLARRDPDADDLRSIGRLVDCCGYLPLAIVLLARRLAHHPSWSISRLVADFAETSHRLPELGAGRLAVHTAFTMSYRYLDADLQRLFRRIGMHPGSECDAYTAAALDERTPAEAARALDALYVDHLVEEPAEGRYRMHDLVREYARALATEDATEERIATTTRLLDFYCHAADRADQYLACKTRPRSVAPANRDPVVPPMSTREDAMAWMGIEWGNILDCLSGTYPVDQRTRLVRLTESLAGFVQLNGPLSLAAALHSRAADWAADLGDDLAAANALDHLGWVRYLADDYDAADAALERAQALYRKVSASQGIANTLGDLARVRYSTGDFAESVELLQQALLLFRKLGDRLGQANTLDDLSLPWLGMGEYGRAADALDEALVIYRELGDRLGQAHVLNHLGRICECTEDYAEAIAAHDSAFALYNEVGDRLGSAHALYGCGRALLAEGSFTLAIDTLHRACRGYEEIGSPLGQARALAASARCEVSREGGSKADAVATLRRALAIFRDLNAPDAAHTANDLAALLAER